MAYLGRGLDKGNYLKLDDLQSQFNGSTTTFNLTSGGTAFYPGSAFSILVSLAGIVQEPESAYQINQNQIIFATAPLSSDDFFCIVLGVPLAVGVAGNSTITGTQLSKPFNYNDGHLFFDSVNNRLGINSTTPRQELDVRGNVIVSGVSTFGNTVVGGGTTQLVVNGNARITGILTIGTSSITLDGSNNQVNVGTAVTVNSSGVTVTGVITATSFSGALTGNATGLSGTPNITVGSIIASNATISGNVSVAGTLTYEDVTNVDSIGIVTARTGVRIDAGGLVVVGVTTVAAGSTAAPSISPTGDSDTGIFFPSADTIAFGEGGAEALRIDSSGNVGIGLTNPRFKLEVGAVGASGTSLHVNGDARVTGILSVGQGTITINGNNDKITTPKLDYAGISSTNADTATDIFVYDTRKDSDGGAWRKKTQNTSWYNETLNTATRGSRRDFPAVAVIVSNSSGEKVTIYDGDDPDMPMWMVFEGVTSSWKFIQYGDDSTVMSVTALNGIMTVGNSGSVYGSLHILNFISETAFAYIGSSGSAGTLFKFNESFINRNVLGSSFPQVLPVLQIVNHKINDVAMTVLPNAPIDPSTGLPVPTIAVATAGGVSVIKDDGTVVDHIDSAGGQSTQVSFTQDGKLVHSHDGHTGIRIDSLKSSDYTYGSNKVALHNSEEFYINYGLTASGWSGNTPKLNDGAFSSGGQIVPVSDNILAERANTGLNLLARDFPSSPNNNRVAYATTSYNTGWMHGDIKGAFLSDTSTASVTGTELVTNGTFDSNVTGWTGYTANGGSVAWQSGGYLRLSNADTNDPPVYAYQTITTVIGQRYIFSAQKVAGIQAAIYASNSLAGTPSSVGNIPVWSSGETGYKFVDFTATATTTYVILRVNANIVNTVDFDNVSVRIAEADRSVNNNGLAVYGTITKSAVATGSNLVGYGGFTSANYLQQPYNSALTFGTNNFSVMLWYYNNTSTEIRVQRTTLGADGWALTLGNAAGDFYIHNGNFTTFASFAGISNTNVWNHWTITRMYNDKWYVYKNGVLVGSTATLASTNFNDLGTFIINSPSGNSANSISLVRVSQSVPSPEQILKIYNDEKFLYQPNSQCTLHGTSNAVTALAYDDTTRLLSVGTSSGRSDFQGLRRINNTTTAVTTAISASNGLIAEQ